MSWLKKLGQTLDIRRVSLVSNVLHMVGELEKIDMSAQMGGWGCIKFGPVQKTRFRGFQVCFERLSTC